ncbi:MAG: acireductone synthase [Acidocella sp.]|nr:acireductone synthase [Acidocella sp.]
MDIEGTTTPIAFVHDVLFPYARARLAGFLDTYAGDPVLDGIPEPKLGSLLDWMERDEKTSALKAIQGRIWEQGYVDGEINGLTYSDVEPSLRRWVRAGLKMFVYSSGSVTAQKNLFRYSEAGDLTGYFQGFFDTNVGAKRDPASYTVICRGANIAPQECLFLSDVEAELDAAAQAGLLTCQIVRPDDGTKAGTRHPTAIDFFDVSTKFNLPHG